MFVAELVVPSPKSQEYEVIVEFSIEAFVKSIVESPFGV